MDDAGDVPAVVAVPLVDDGGDEVGALNDGEPAEKYEKDDAAAAADDDIIVIVIALPLPLATVGVL